MKLILSSILLLTTMTVRSQSFEKIDNVVTQTASGSRAVNFIDVNKDGWLDIFVTNGPKDGQNNTLYINDQEGDFEKQTTGDLVSDRSPSDGSTWGDADNDGFEDLFVVTWYGEDNFLYENRGGTVVISSAINSDGFSETASWADYNKDGYLDLFITNSSSGSGDFNEFFVNNGDGTFSKGTTFAITDTKVNSRSVNWIDFDNDNDLDLFVSNEGTANEFYINNGGSFTRQNDSDLVSSVLNSTGSSWADYDNDGDLDLYVANFNQANELYKNLGGGDFSKLTVGSIVSDVDYSFGTAWGDIDNDGDLDLYVANGFKTDSRLFNRLYINNGDGTFTSDMEHTIVSEAGWSFGAAFGDYDNDGFLDLMVANTFDESQKNSLYHNLGNDNNWLIVDLEGTASNRSAIGAKVKVTATIGDDEITQLREISSQSCYNGQNSLRAHFGLGSAENITKLEVIWPNGNSEIIDEEEINKIVKIKETVPVDFLRADFTLSESKYLTNSEIAFTDLSVYPENESVTYAWDFDNDGVIDSTEPSPKATFDNIGDYSVKLVVKSANNSSEKVKSEYLKVRNTLLSAVSTNTSDRLTVYPNPTTNELSLSANFIIKAYEVFTMDGKSMIYGEPSDTNLTDLNIGSLNLTEGLYTLVVSGKEQNLIVKFVIKN